MRYALANHKAGAGKTTLAGCLAESLAARGQRVLCVDMDPQANLTRRLGYTETDLTHLVTVSDVIKADELGCAAQAVLTCRWPLTHLAEHIDLLPSRFDLEHRIPEAGQLGAHLRLVRGLTGVTDEYDAVLIDCPPALGHLTQLALAATDGVIMPVRPAYDHIAGAARVRDFLTTHAAHLGRPGLALLGVIVTEPDHCRGLPTWHRDLVTGLFGDLVWQPVIPSRTQLAEVSAAAEPLRLRGLATADLVSIFDALTDQLEACRAAA
jgi:chromosome partitioning protein